MKTKQLMTGKTCLVTGANSGIGFATANDLAAKGADLIMICRSESKGMAALTQIKEQTGHTPTLILADLSDIKETQRAASEVAQQCEKLDVLVNNAGGYFPDRVESNDGFDMNFALNHLGYFVLTQSLRPLLEATPASRIVNVASRAHRMARLNFDDLQWQRRRYSAFVAYGTSKLLNILFTRELARRLQGTDTTANCYHPGVVRTGFGQDYSGLFNLATRVAGLLFLTPEQGAETGIYLASDPKAGAFNGDYFVKCRSVKPKPAGRNDEHARMLWTLSEDIVSRLGDKH